MSRIDDPLDALWSQYPAEQENSVGEAALSIAGHVVLPIAIFNSIRDHFRSEGRKGRVDILLDALKSRLQHVESLVGENRERMAAVQAKLESPEFNEAVLLAAEEAARAVNEEKIRDFAEILGRAVEPRNALERKEDLASIVRSVAQLNKLDIHVLRILEFVHGPALATYPNAHDPQPFSIQTGQLLREVEKAGILREQFYSHCFRLQGFGLAVEVPRNPGQMAPGDYCFRPTRLGLRLLKLLVGTINDMST